jgi:uncharacterized protein (DUF934 family)
MALIKNHQLMEDPYTRVSAGEPWPDSGALLVGLDQWQEEKPALLARNQDLGLILQSDQHPELIVDDLEHLQLVALEFPVFRDGRAFSYARLLRRFGFKGEIRAIGDVLLDQLHYMQRVGFDAFDITAADPLAAYKQASQEFGVWYQPAADGRPWASGLRTSGSD